MKKDAGNANLMNGVPELLILRTLSRREMYGYELVRAIHASTGEKILLSEGCVYPLLHAMERKKWLASRRAAADGRTRVYYRLTPKGNQRLEKIVSQWNGMSSAIHLALGGDREQSMPA